MCLCVEAEFLAVESFVVVLESFGVGCCDNCIVVVGIVVFKVVGRWCLREELGLCLIEGVVFELLEGIFVEIIKAGVAATLLFFLAYTPVYLTYGNDALSL